MRRGFDNTKARSFAEFRKPKEIEEGGIIRISGDFLLDHEEDILNLIKHESRLINERNPKARLTKIDKKDGGILAQFSDHNLAMHVGKQLHRAYKGKHSYKFLKQEKFIEVDWRRD